MSQLLQFDFIPTQSPPCQGGQEQVYSVNTEIGFRVFSAIDAFVEYVTTPELCIPFSFDDALADWQQGRVVDIDTALGEKPPDL